MAQSVLVHPFEPFWRPQSTILILGTFPSVASRENQFYYGHPCNRFWQVLSNIYGEKLPLTIPEKKSLLAEHNLALWDVLCSCEIKGSSDASIRQPVANDIPALISKSSIKKILLNGKKAYYLLEKYVAHDTQIPAVCLPSTSPANASCRLPQLLETWGKEIFD